MRKRDPYMWIDDRRVFEIGDGETHCIIATSRIKAIGVIARFCGYDEIREYEHDMEPVVRMCDPMEMIKVIDEDGNTRKMRAVQWLLEPTNDSNLTHFPDDCVLCSTTLP